MAWIESHQELARHPKTRRLCRELGINLREGIGLLHLLWWWALDYADDGDISTYDASDIADACLWDGDADALLDALVQAGWIDQDADGRHIHDWDDYAGRILDQRRANAERQRRHRERSVTGANDNSDTPRTSPLRHAHVTRTSPLRNGATVPNLTVPNLTVPNPYTSNVREGDGGSVRGDSADASSPVAAFAAPPRPNPQISLSNGANERHEEHHSPLEDGDAHNTAVRANSHVETLPPAARTVPKPNKLTEVIDACRVLGVEPVVTPRDGKAVKECSAGPALIAEAYAAASHGNWGDAWLVEHLSLHMVCERVDGYLSWRNGAVAHVRARDRPQSVQDRSRELLRRVIAEEEAKEQVQGGYHGP